MSLSDIMSAAGLAGYAEVGLVLFLVTFVAISIWTFAKSNESEWESARLLPLRDEELAPRVAPLLPKGGRS